MSVETFWFLRRKLLEFLWIYRHRSTWLIRRAPGGLKSAEKSLVIRLIIRLTKERRTKHCFSCERYHVYWPRDNKILRSIFSNISIDVTVTWSSLRVSILICKCVAKKHDGHKSIVISVNSETKCGKWNRYPNVAFLVNIYKFIAPVKSYMRRSIDRKLLYKSKMKPLSRYRAYEKKITERRTTDRRIHMEFRAIAGVGFLNISTLLLHLSLSPCLYMGHKRLHHTHSVPSA